VIFRLVRIPDVEAWLQLGMSRWFRHYAGMMRDDKLVRVAIRSGQTIERVVWVYGRHSRKRCGD
jgi:hypothetical protein